MQILNSAIKEKQNSDDSVDKLGKQNLDRVGWVIKIWYIKNKYLDKIFLILIGKMEKRHGAVFQRHFMRYQVLNFIDPANNVENTTITFLIQTLEGN